MWRERGRKHYHQRAKRDLKWRGGLRANGFEIKLQRKRIIFKMRETLRRQKDTLSLNKKKKKTCLDGIIIERRPHTFFFFFFTKVVNGSGFFQASVHTHITVFICLTYYKPDRHLRNKPADQILLVGFKWANPACYSFESQASCGLRNKPI